MDRPGDKSYNDVIQRRMRDIQAGLRLRYKLPVSGMRVFDALVSAGHDYETAHRLASADQPPVIGPGLTPVPAIPEPPEPTAGPSPADTMPGVYRSLRAIGLTHDEIVARFPPDHPPQGLAIPDLMGRDSDI